ncbi:uncharacterized protein [Halyomorpha halys]|uniref:uncharacterized protein n=1 Tax=Halyomorpha halys TaxID=286706 RepID=UPI0034D3261A
MLCLLAVLLLYSRVVLNVWALPQGREHRVLRIKGENGTLERTIFLPNVLQDDDDRYVLISDSSQNKYKVTETKRKIKRRRKKKPVSQQIDNNNITDYKDPKFLNLFTIVKFDNDDCGEGGVCYHEYECNELGGIPQGPCARGFGVCCMLEAQCGETVKKAVSLFVGQSSQGACTLGIQKMECARQIRLDFFSLDLEGPLDGTCMIDRLLISGQNSNDIVPILCGSNSGQHMNLDIDEVEGPIMLSVISPSKRNFKMKVTQLCDGDPLLAPKGCLQYYTDPFGEIKSFNYQDQSTESAYLNNLNYAMCIKKNPGMCTVEYSNTRPTGEEYTFDINNVDLDGELTVPEGEAGVEVFNCPEDYLAIAGLRLCGQKFNDATTNADFTQNAPVTDKSNGPFIMSFVSSSTNTGRGFHLQYQQKPCL